MRLTTQEASEITFKLSDKGIILDNNISSPTFQDEKNIIFKSDFYCADNIIHELCHFLVANGNEKKKTNLGLDDGREKHILFKEVEAFLLQEKFYKEIVVEDDPNSRITGYKNYILERLPDVVNKANKKDYSKNLNKLLEAYNMFKYGIAN